MIYVSWRFNEASQHNQAHQSVRMDELLETLSFHLAIHAALTMTGNAKMTCNLVTGTKQAARLALTRYGPAKQLMPVCADAVVHCFAKLSNAIKSPFTQANEVTNSAVYRLVLAFNIRVDEMHAVISVMC
jgi:hypothetical protein